MATVNELREMVRQVHAAGARYVLVDRMNLKRGVWSALARAMSTDRSMMAVARRHLFPDRGEPNFYSGAIRVVEEEAKAMGMPVSRA